MSASTELDRGRAAYGQRQWRSALTDLAEADRADRLASDDLVRQSTSAFMMGRFSEGVGILTRAHEELLAAGDLAGAARAAGWLGMQFMFADDFAQGGGWLARAERLASQRPSEPALRGIPMVVAALDALYGGDPAQAMQQFGAIADLGDAHSDADLAALGRLGKGQAMVMLDDPVAGFVLLDEAMVAVTAGEVSPVPAGIIYCAVIGTCHLACDVQRAHEWTVALDHWCQSQQDLVSFSGQCQMHRAALFLLHGAWQEAVDAALAAQQLFERGDRMAGFGAYYQLGEVQRLRGQFHDAEASYVAANRSGFDPEPGLALLRLAQGQARAARDLIERAEAAADPATRRQMLPAQVEIDLAVADVAAATAATAELTAQAAMRGLPLLQAMAAQAQAQVALAQSAPEQAERAARGAVRMWRQLDAPYDEALCRMLIGEACRDLGDDETAALQFGTARDILNELGAQPALADLDRIESAHTQAPAGGLTGREIEVLRLVSAGMTNRQIAGELYLSEKTVARHLSNIFTKLNLPSRAAATAYAYEHQLVTR
jgi:DNA-binding NarL/FixJ family response regulator